MRLTAFYNGLIMKSSTFLYMDFHASERLRFCFCCPQRIEIARLLLQYLHIFLYALL